MVDFALSQGKIDRETILESMESSRQLRDLIYCYEPHFHTTKQSARQGPFCLSIRSNLHNIVSAFTKSGEILYRSFTIAF